VEVVRLLLDRGFDVKALYKVNICLFLPLFSHSKYLLFVALFAVWIDLESLSV
jgi:hypothetical protein